MFKFILLFIQMNVLIFIFISCHTISNKIGDTPNLELKKSYKVEDASSQIRPGWILDPEEYFKNEKYFAQYNYFAFETELKIDREMACEYAKMNIKADIAAEIKTNIMKRIGFSKEGENDMDLSDEDVKKLKSYIEIDMTEKVEQSITGIRIKQTYWEKRVFENGKYGYTCAVLVQIPRFLLEITIKEAKEDLLDNTPNDALRNKVKQNVENLRSYNSPF